jgi:hypothetical protein
MFVVSEEATAAIRAVYKAGGALPATVGAAPAFPGIRDNADAIK